MRGMSQKELVELFTAISKAGNEYDPPPAVAYRTRILRFLTDSSVVEIASMGLRLPLSLCYELERRLGMGVWDIP